jgi:hypothetical protein
MLKQVYIWNHCVLNRYFIICSREIILQCHSPSFKLSLTHINNTTNEHSNYRWLFKTRKIYLSFSAICMCSPAINSFKVACLILNKCLLVVTAAVPMTWTTSRDPLSVGSRSEDLNRQVWAGRYIAEGNMCGTINFIKTQDSIIDFFKDGLSWRRFSQLY